MDFRGIHVFSVKVADNIAKFTNGGIINHFVKEGKAIPVTVLEGP
jgi:hypothetical protein